MPIALVREVSPSIERCELLHLERTPIDYPEARAQHHHYVDCLAELGCRIHVLPSEPELPDAVFVEDTAVILKELAVITRPGAESRRGEILSVARTLQGYRELFFIEDPGTLDGGDVLVIGRVLYVGLSMRTNRAGVEQLRNLVGNYGYSVVPVEFRGCLHLKSAVTQVAEDTLLINSEWVRPADLPAESFVVVDPAEPMGANALLLGGAVIYPSHYPRTRELMEEIGIDIMPVPASELAKAEGGVTCCSLIL